MISYHKHSSLSVVQMRTVIKILHFSWSYSLSVMQIQFEMEGDSQRLAAGGVGNSKLLRGHCL